MTLKEWFVVEVIKEGARRTGGCRPLKVLDLGCGAAAYVPMLIREYQGIQYVGVEPIHSSYRAAVGNIEGIPNARVHCQLGYDGIPREDACSFDVVFSLSVLEHVKRLDRFLALGAKYALPGGLIVHRYDLGHALFPHSLKEWLHVKIGNHVPAILPERRFVRYLSSGEVRDLYEQQGIRPIRTTYHQMPDHKALEKLLKHANTSAISELFAWEMAHQEDFLGLPEGDRERLFPAVAVWGEKR